ncbi:MAG: efflux RND transporter periplasmic adaptor subunit [Myxococcales bacterium]|nr:efflux RND transporter periplasmic adaptor subunit [Myxococcales bacterium]
MAIVVASGCDARAGDGRKGGRKDTDAAEVEEQATPVVAGAVTRGAITNTIAIASTIEAEQQVTVHAESTGRIVSLKAEEGAEVKEGARLAQIKYDTQTSALDRANTSLSKATEDYDRSKRLFDSGAIGREELENAKNALDMAKLDVRDRRREMRNTKVIAPFSGTIVERQVAEGAFVTSGAALLTITDFNTLVARVYVPEKELDRLAVGQEAEIIGKAAKGRKATGKIERIAPIVDASTGTVKVTISLPRESVGPGGFLPGMYAEVTLTTDHHEDVPLVPKSAVIYDEDQAYVFVIDGERVKRVRVEIGLSDAEFVELSSGPAPGEPIAIAGQAGLKDGSLITLVDYQGNPLAPGEQAAPKDAPAEDTKEDARGSAQDDAKAGEVG